ncbi:XRE family transcriptional regulator [Pseudomonas sp. UBA6562]|uniref:XRE family transcriptional regulator n=1 Tax=Pseudomonas sp. UBA6562 TaxID=1947332 RepID=UPI0025FE4BFC|nr:XRE family transcriptional regulator [Pseudomonas sp. UBA6562]
MHKSIDKILAQLMSAGGVSQVELSTRTGVGQSTISRILKPSGPKGIKEPTDKQVRPLAEYFRVSTDQLRGYAPLEASAVAIADSKPASSAAEVVKQMLASKAGMNLSERAREAMLAAAVDADQPESDGQYIPASYANLRPTQEEILIPQYDVRAAMGHGQVPADYNEVIRNLIIREDVLREKGVTYTSPHSLAMITGWGQSMEGTINDKDPLIVDRGVNDYVGDGIYVLTWHEHLFIKRVQIKDAEHFWLISDNPNHKDAEARAEDLTFHAKVLLAWNAKKL